MVKTNFSNQTTDAVLTEQQYRIEALQKEIKKLKAILIKNNYFNKQETFVAID